MQMQNIHRTQREDSGMFAEIRDAARIVKDTRVEGLIQRGLDFSAGDDGSKGPKKKKGREAEKWTAFREIDETDGRTASRVLGKPGR